MSHSIPDAPPWLSGLREEWMNEIGAMTAERRRWFAAQGIDTRFDTKNEKNQGSGQIRTAPLDIVPQTVSLDQEPHVSISSQGVAVEMETVWGSPDGSMVSSSIKVVGDGSGNDLVGTSLNVGSYGASSLHSDLVAAVDRSKDYLPYSITEVGNNLVKVGKDSIAASISTIGGLIPPIFSVQQDATSPSSDKFKAVSTLFKYSSQRANLVSKKVAVMDPAKSNSQNSYYSRLFGSISVDPLIADLNAYLVSIRKAIAEQEDKMLALQKERKLIRARMAKESERWDKYALESLSSLCRTLYETQLLHNSNSIELSNSIVGSLSHQLNQMQQILELKKFKDGYLLINDTELLLLKSAQSDILYLLEPENFPIFLVQNIPEMKELNVTLKSFNQIISALFAQYSDLQLKSLVVERKSDRVRRYSQFFSELVMRVKAASIEKLDYASSGLYFHSLEFENVSAFRQLVFDQRQWEGLSIFRFLQRLMDALVNVGKEDQKKCSDLPIAAVHPRASLASISVITDTPVGDDSPLPQERLNGMQRRSSSTRIVTNTSIHSFIIALEDALRVKYQLNNEWFNHVSEGQYIGSCAQLCLERQIYPKLGEMGVWPSRFITPLERASDEHFRKDQVPWLTTLAPQQLGIDLEYFSAFHEFPRIFAIEDLFPDVKDLISIIPHIDVISNYPNLVDVKKEIACPACNFASLPTCFMTGDYKLRHALDRVILHPSKISNFSNPSDLPVTKCNEHAGWWLVRRTLHHDVNFPFSQAIHCLSKLNDTCVPLDMLFCILQTIRLISAEAKKNFAQHRRMRRLLTKIDLAKYSCCAAFCKYHHAEEISPDCCLCSLHDNFSFDSESEREADQQNIVIDADTLFPLVVFVVLHACVPLYSCFGLIERSIGSTNALHFGEIGLCVTLVEAALHHLSKLNPVQCMLPSYVPDLVVAADIRLDSLQILKDSHSNEELLSFAVYIPFDMFESSSASSPPFVSNTERRVSSYSQKRVSVADVKTLDCSLFQAEITEDSGQCYNEVGKKKDTSDIGSEPAVSEASQKEVILPSQGALHAVQNVECRETSEIMENVQLILNDTESRSSIHLENLETKEPIETVTTVNAIISNRSDSDDMLSIFSDFEPFSPSSVIQNYEFSTANHPESVVDSVPCSSVSLLPSFSLQRYSYHSSVLASNRFIHLPHSYIIFM